MILEHETVAAVAAHVVVVAWAGLHVLANKRSLTALAWLGLIASAPVFGVAWYLLVGIDRLGPRARARRVEGEGVRVALAPLVEDDRVWRTRAASRADRPLDELHHLLDRICPYPEVGGNRVDVLVGGDEAFPAMLAAIDAAESFVLLETYIWRSDGIGTAFLDALRRAAGRGVQCVAIFDGFGATGLRRRDVVAARRAGVKVHPFSPVRGLLGRFRLNHRTHRKILVVDGGVAFVGGLNLSQAYGTDERGRLDVRDHHFAVRGPVVQQLTQAFLEEVVGVTGKVPDYEAWFPPVQRAGDDRARVVPSGPDDERLVHYAAVLAAISAARGCVRIATAFFIPEEPLSMALQVAALGGVEVRLLLPERSDHFFADAARDAYLDALLAAGVRIRYAPSPFLHSKLFTVDSEWACVGSSNLDPRSLRLNFEINLGVEGDAVGRIEEAFDLEWERGRETTVEERRGRGLWRRAWSSFWSLWTPLL